MPWLAVKMLGLARGWWLLIALAALASLIWWFSAAEKADDRANQQIGRSEAVIESQGKALESVETANEAREEIEQRGPAGDRVRYEQCLRSARTPGNCERFLPR